MTDPVTYRPINSADMPFLFRLYATTREDELNLVDWDDDQKQAFLEQQFHAQHVYYQEQFSVAEFHVIEHQDRPIGRRYIDRNENEIRLIDLAILPEFQGRGIGSRILTDLMGEAKKLGRPIRHHVERFNRALHLYQRLGFSVIEDRGVHLLMEWSPTDAGAMAGETPPGDSLHSADT